MGYLAGHREGMKWLHLAGQNGDFVAAEQLLEVAWQVQSNLHVATTDMFDGVATEANRGILLASLAVEHSPAVHGVTGQATSEDSRIGYSHRFELLNILAIGPMHFVSMVVHAGPSPYRSHAIMESIFSCVMALNRACQAIRCKF